MTDTNRHRQRRRILEGTDPETVDHIEWDPELERLTFTTTSGTKAVLQLPVDPERVTGLTDIFNQPVL